MKQLLTKFFLLLLFTTSSAKFIFGQNDSMLIQIEENAYNALTDGEFDSARILYKQIIKQFPEQSRMVGLSYNNLGIIDLSEGFNTRAISYSEKAIKVYREFKNDTLIATSLYNAARVYKRFGQYEKAITYLLKAVTIFEKQHMIKDLARTYNVLANIYKVTDDFDVALEFHNMSIKEGAKIEDSLIIISSINNRGKTYTEMEYFDLAIEDFKTTLSYNIREGDIKSSGFTYYNLGEVELIRKNIEDANNYLLKALKIHTEFNNIREIGFTINHLGEIAGNKKDWLKGEIYFKRSENLANKLEDSELLIANYESQSSFYEEKGDFKKALNYSRLFNNLYRKNLNEHTQKVIEELQIEYEVRKVEQENQLLAQQAEIDSLEITQKDSSIKLLTISIIVTIIIIILVLLLGFWFYRLSLKDKRQAILEKELATKEKRFNTEQHHRIKNHLQLLAGLLSFQQRKLENIAAKEIIQESSNRVKAITTLHQHFYQSDDLSSTVIQLDAYLESLIGNLSILFKQQSVQIIQELEPVKIDADKALPLGLICNEIITNAFKYGLTRTNQPTLYISLKKEQEKHKLYISDNGSGIQSDTNSSSIGLELINQMVRQIDAKLNQENNSGTSFKLSF